MRGNLPLYDIHNDSENENEKNIGRWLLCQIFLPLPNLNPLHFSCLFLTVFLMRWSSKMKKLLLFKWVEHETINQNSLHENNSMVLLNLYITP